MNYYEILEITNTASEEVIKGAYKALVKKYHPDNLLNGEAQKDINLINEAYETLSNPEKRKIYDEKLGLEKRNATASNTSYATRNVQTTSFGKWGDILINIGKEIFNTIDQKNSEIQNAYYEGCGMDNYKLVKVFQSASLLKRAGYARALEDRGLLTKDKNGKYIPTQRFHYYT